MQDGRFGLPCAEQFSPLMMAVVISEIAQDIEPTDLVVDRGISGIDRLPVWPM
jgi:hypothetical protein